MKKMYTLFVFSVLALAFSCDKDKDNSDQYKGVFEYEITFENKTEVYFGDDATLNFSITPKTPLKEVTYSYSFSFLQGEGKLYTQDGELLSKNYVLDAPYQGINENFIYIAEKIGTHEINVTAKDNFDYEKTTTLIFEVAYVPFQFTAEPTDNEGIVNTPVTIYFNLSDLENVGFQESDGVETLIEQKYELKAEIKGGSADLLLEGEKITQNRFFEVETGQWTMDFVTKNVADYLITFTLKDQNNQEIVEEFGLKIIQTDFLFDASPLKNQATTQTPVVIDIKLTESVQVDDTYSLWINSNLAGNYSHNGKKYELLERITDIKAGDFQIEFIGTDIGNYNLTVYIESSSNLRKEEAVSIEFLPKTVDAIIEASTARQIDNDKPVFFSVEIKQQINSNIEYTLYFDTTFDGGVFYKGNEYKKNIAIPLEKRNGEYLDYSLYFTPKTLGKNTITWTILTNDDSSKIIESRPITSYAYFDVLDTKTVLQDRSSGFYVYTMKLDRTVAELKALGVNQIEVETRLTGITQPPKSIIALSDVPQEFEYLTFYTSIPQKKGIQNFKGKFLFDDNYLAQDYRQFDYNNNNCCDK